MSVALAGRVIGPVATLALLGYLAGFPPEFTATYAVLAAFVQLTTAPLNPYAEHFQLREILSGRTSGLGAGLAGLGLTCAVSAGLVIGLGESLWVLAIIPVIGLGHLLSKVLAAKLRAGQRNGLATTLEFTLRPLVLLLLVALIFSLSGPSESGLMLAFGLTGLSIIAITLAMNGQAHRTANASDHASNDTPATAGVSPWAFVFLGMLMVLANQFEVLALSRLADAQALATFKVAIQLASVCGIATNFILLNNLRELYAHSTSSPTYGVLFKKVKVQSLWICTIFVAGFTLFGLMWPLLWPRETWLLSAAASSVFAISAAFGPLTNWFYANGRIRPLALSLGLMLALKLVFVFGLGWIGLIGPGSLLVVFGLGILTQNLFLLAIKSREPR